MNRKSDVQFHQRDYYFPYFNTLVLRLQLIYE